MASKFVPLLLAVVACVGGGDDSDAAAQGTLGGPCFSNNTCNSGLTCVLESGRGICQTPDATVSDAPVDQNASDGGVADAQPDADACSSTLAPAEPCKSCDLAGFCCPSVGKCSDASTVALCANDVCGGQPCWECQTRKPCGNDFCCLDNTTVQPTCPPSIGVNTAPTCQTTCGAGVILCVTTVDCPSSKPTCLGVTASGVNGSVLGVCQ